MQNADILTQYSALLRRLRTSQLDMLYSHNFKNLCHNEQVVTLKELAQLEQRIADLDITLINRDSTDCPVHLIMKA